MHNSRSTDVWSLKLKSYNIQADSHNKKIRFTKFRQGNECIEIQQVLEKIAIEITTSVWWMSRLHKTSTLWGCAAEASSPVRS